MRNSAHQKYLSEAKAQINLCPVLLVGDVLHPIDDFAVEFFLNGDVAHRRLGAAPCQCFSPGENQTTSPGRISSIGPPSRCTQPQPEGDDQRLTERMRVPGRARARLESDESAGNTSRVWPKHRIDPDRPGEPLRWPFADGCDPLRLMSIDSPFRSRADKSGRKGRSGVSRKLLQPCRPLFARDNFRRCRGTSLRCRVRPRNLSAAIKRLMSTVVIQYSCVQ